MSRLFENEKSKAKKDHIYQSEDDDEAGKNATSVEYQKTIHVTVS